MIPDMRPLYAAFAVFFVLTLPSFAQAVADAAPAVEPVTTIVQVPVGSWATTALGYLALSLGGVVVWGFRFLPPQLYALAMTVRADQLMQKGLAFAINSAAGKIPQGAVWTIDVRNDILRDFVVYLLAHGSDAVKAFIGTPADMAEKGFARLATPAVDATGNTQPTPLPATPKPDFVRIGAQAEVAADLKGVQAA
jgi:hypothetical protein